MKNGPKFFFIFFSMAAKRFQEKLFLPKECMFKLQQVFVNLQPVPEWVQNNSIELYHSTRNQKNGIYVNVHKRISSWSGL
jgi:hypothetical protein